ncbi:MAG: prolyl oligopeptidase family serine peptidase, partial [Nevskiales bacterium]
NPETGGGEWPGLGISSSGWDVLETFNVGDPETNTIKGALPLPAGDTWRVQAVLAQADGTVMNVAFRGPDEIAGAVPAISAGTAYVDADKGGYWEDRQAAALAAGDISQFGHVVQVADMRNGVTRAAEVGPGLHERIYTSAYTVGAGEGVDMDGVPGVHGDTGLPCEQYFYFVGKYQPYAIYLPAGEGPHSLQLQLHGCGDTHGSQMNEPGFQARFGDEPNRIIVSPLSRGPQGFFHNLAERDWLDVLDDTIEHYAIDEDQLFVSGTSMGGFGALRTAAMYPDRFAGMINWVGFTGNIGNTPLPGNPVAELLTQLTGGPFESTGITAGTGADINIIEFVQNLRHVPSVNLYSSADELVHVTTGIAMLTAFDAAEVEHHSYMHTPAEHLTFVILDDWQKEAAYIAGRRLKKNPARVSYKTDSRTDAPEYGVFHDKAYWLSAIREREEGVSEVDLQSYACGKDQPLYGQGIDAGVDPAPLTWVRLYRDITGMEMATAENRLEGSLHNVGSLMIDAAATCLSAGTTYAIESDGPATLQLSDGRSLQLDAGLNEGSF